MTHVILQKESWQGIEKQTNLTIHASHMTPPLEVVRPPPPQNNKFIHMGVVVVPNHQELISPHLHEIISKHSNHHPK